MFASNMQTLLDLVRVTVKLLYIGLLYKGHFKRIVFLNSRLAQSLEDPTMHFKVVGFESHYGQEFFVLNYFAFHSILAAWLSAYKRNQARYSSEVIGRENNNFTELWRQ